MNQTEQDWHDALTRTLKNLDSDLSASECHGAICGLMAAGHLDSAARTVPVLIELVGGNIADQAALLGEIHQACLQQFESEAFELSLLIDDESEAQRLTDLAQWTQGFLLGVGWGGGLTQHSAETHQALDDLVQISRVSLEDDIDPKDLEDVHEYVRMSAHLVFVETHAAKSPSGA